MFRSLRALGLEFWLPLPLLGLLFWAGSSLIERQLLHRSNSTVAPVQVEPRRSPAASVLSIKVEIDRDRSVSQVSVSTITSTVKTRKFEVSVVEQKQVERAIAQQLSLPLEQIKELTQYEIKN
ncbi:MAG: hypothetical protein F6K28_45365 [Microcoleus sp. SIO2G3]|nr:hypothetical protein [Microcoleus sp. SIO2G3]